MGRIIVEVVTPSRKVLSVEADDLLLPGSRGEMGVLPGHAAMVATLGTGLVQARSGGQTTRIAVRNGFVHVEGDRASLLADLAATPSEIDRTKLDQEIRDIEAKMIDPSVGPEDREELIHQGEWVRAKLALA